jgi:Holliday junction resolvasome RuvABC endonuclease subunit
MLYQNISLSNEPKNKWKSNLLEKGYAWHTTGELLGHTGVVIGVDPGVNFGVTVIYECYIHIFNGKLKTQKDRRIEYSILAHDLIHELVHEYGGNPTTLVLEGAAFNKTFGQVNLAEVRTGYYMAMRSYGEVEVPAPMSVRKAVFGDGKMQPMDIWPHLNHNAADSLSIALYGLK